MHRHAHTVGHGDDRRVGRNGAGHVNQTAFLILDKTARGATANPILSLLILFRQRRLVFRVVVFGVRLVSHRLARKRAGFVGATKLPAAPLHGLHSVKRSLPRGKVGRRLLQPGKLGDGHTGHVRHRCRGRHRHHRRGCRRRRHNRELRDPIRIRHDLRNNRRCRTAHDLLNDALELGRPTLDLAAFLHGLHRGSSGVLGHICLGGQRPGHILKTALGNPSGGDGVLGDSALRLALAVCLHGLLHARAALEFRENEKRRSSA